MHQALARPTQALSQREIQWHARGTRKNLKQYVVAMHQGGEGASSSVIAHALGGVV